MLPPAIYHQHRVQPKAYKARRVASKADAIGGCRPQTPKRARVRTENLRIVQLLAKLAFLTVKYYRAR
jgi:hypothetical protein